MDVVRDLLRLDGGVKLSEARGKQEVVERGSMDREDTPPSRYRRGRTREVAGDVPTKASSRQSSVT